MRPLAGVKSHFVHRILLIRIARRHKILESDQFVRCHQSVVPSLIVESTIEIVLPDVHPSRNVDCPNVVPSQRRDLEELRQQDWGDHPNLIGISGDESMYQRHQLIRK